MYEKKFRYIFVTCASRKSYEDIFAELKTRFTNKYIIELDIVSQEKMKIIELHITKLRFKKFVQTPNKGDGNCYLFLFSFKIVLAYLPFFF
ncbi:hypothetical protein AHAS_Ahas19G0166400 [Arachis hypogaea]